ncbi:uncharacterized protein MELLADRAFT_124124 [Melampsora larici-populina 98AG31]|uniref:Secreted protein n=1 Tax=Melampsora larici-populina (strain 98AG31 / pathotype 3-4-7) TaxID=747676 RepID=F4RKS8_MELLP|nr:uncharacterized protein MELLADRAFT_124124 [Melampsora larici-populina 98AG31]EGG06988.1 secreted protein [Melampsora larici-populina 98AG31]
MTRIFGLSTTVIAVLFLACPFLTWAFQWNDQFNFIHAITEVREMTGADVKDYLGQLPVKEDEIKNSVEKFFTYLDSKDITNTISQFHPQGVLMFWGQTSQGEGIRQHMQSLMSHMGTNCNTKIDTLRCYQLSDDIVEVGCHGEMSQNLQGQDRVDKFIVVMTLEKQGGKVKICKLMKARMEPQAGSIVPSMKERMDPAAGSIVPSIKATASRVGSSLGQWLRGKMGGPNSH